MKTITPQQLQSIGYALYHSASWKIELARALGVSVRTVKAWAAGKMPIHPKWIGEIHQLAYIRLSDIEFVMNDILLPILETH